MFRKLRNEKPIGNVLGKVINPPPELKISILEGQITLYPDQLYMTDNLWNDYYRTYKIESEITEMTRDIENYSFQNTTATEIASLHTHPIKTLAGKGSDESTGDYKAQGDFWFTDTLKKNDLVMLVPTIDEQTWFIVDKVRKVK
ncbi:MULTISPECIES: DUF2577 family protein [Psychrilyobacter]|uniref:DUF2577 domain-containing protein n=1 Tax=Psychrilyobacter piezotolerans TaxID=2293438 RepID=A0ABX9KIM3_9FUSO|nr:MULTISPECIES: DUF2577 family protein [Psychrilyobacter]MCS5420775.1 DUF2577 domain-containing protein [Psychrilyobacter sp. S5]NDI77431.1 DUF2577 domain-containing protein [Psychrilyobacter piezotolerans]RDE63734.1 DUF2577 domain-containing protein [Psychrilyobacter sp. S5]REI42078.1 DUF2577 domain-containing protein [Psychrilyobacter piezotolerans]